MMKNQKRAVCLLACLLIAGFTAAQEKKESAQTASGSKEEGNRNVMLNASSANGPREISIGLPGGDVNVLENGLPVVYTSNPHNVNTHWRGDSSLGHVGLLKISETAITTGNIGYAVNSFTQLGTETSIIVPITLASSSSMLISAVVWGKDGSTVEAFTKILIRAVSNCVLHRIRTVLKSIKQP